MTKGSFQLWSQSVYVYTLLEDESLNAHIAAKLFVLTNLKVQLTLNPFCVMVLANDINHRK